MEKQTKHYAFAFELGTGRVLWEKDLDIENHDSVSSDDLHSVTDTVTTVPGGSEF